MALLQKLRRNLAGLIDPESHREPMPAGRKRTRAVSAETLYDRMRYLVPAGRDPAAKSGRVNLISLSRIRARLGSEWPHYAIKADRIARNAIEQYLIGGDIYARWKDDGYIVVYATLDSHQAQIKSKLIGNEITEKLFGEDAGDLSDVRHVEVQDDGAVTFSDPPGFEAVVALTVGQSGDAEVAPAPRIEMVSSPFVADAEPVPPAVPKNRSDPLAELSYSYRPSWDPARGVIAAYLCVPMLPEVPGGIRRRRAALVLQDDRAALEKLDFVVLDHVLGMLHELVREQRRLLITLPVRFETLSAAVHRRRYIESLHARLRAEAASLLVIELVAVPDGVPEARLLEISSPLRAHARAVIARLRPDVTEFSQFAASRIAAIGCDLGEHVGSELSLMQQMARFSRGAAKAGVATYLRGIPSLSLATAALGAGFSYLDGDAIAPMVDRPQGISEFSLFDLYNPSLEG